MGLKSNKERKEHKHCTEIQKIQSRRLNGENLRTNELKLTLDVTVVLRTAAGKLRASDYKALATVINQLRREVSKGTDAEKTFIDISNISLRKCNLDCSLKVT